MIENAWLSTLEDGIHTPDIRVTAEGARCVGTREFVRAVAARLGRKPERLLAAMPSTGKSVAVPPWTKPAIPAKELVGVDVFLDWDGHPEVLGTTLGQLAELIIPLQMITNRGVKVWPNGFPETQCTNHWRCRFQAPNGRSVPRAMLLELLRTLDLRGFDCIKTENLYTFDGEPGFSLGQGQ